MTSGLLKNNVAYKVIVYKSFNTNIRMKRIWFYITFKGWYAIKPNQPTKRPFSEDKFFRFTNRNESVKNALYAVGY